MQKVRAHILTEPQEGRGWSCDWEAGGVRIKLKGVQQFYFAFRPEDIPIERVRRLVDEVENKLSLAGTYRIEEGSD